MFCFPTCSLRERKCLTIPAGRCLYNSTWSHISCWWCRCTTTCLKTRRYVSVSPWLSLSAEGRYLMLAVCLFFFSSFPWRFVTAHTQSADMFRLLQSLILTMTRWSVDANFRLRLRPTLFPPNYAVCCGCSTVEQRPLLSQREKDRRGRESWQDDWSAFPFRTTFVYYFPLQQPKDPLPSPSEHGSPQELSLDGFG